MLRLILFFPLAVNMDIQLGKPFCHLLSELTRSFSIHVYWKILLEHYSSLNLTPVHPLFKKKQGVYFLMQYVTSAS